MKKERDSAIIALQITLVEIPNEMTTNTAMSTITNKSMTKTNTGKENFSHEGQSVAHLSSFGYAFPVICQKRVRVFHQEFQNRKTDESTRPQAEYFSCSLYYIPHMSLILFCIGTTMLKSIL